jgi:hypothetical protein
MRPALDQEVDVIGQPRRGVVFSHRNTSGLDCTPKDSDLMTSNTI